MQHSNRASLDSGNPEWFRREGFPAGKLGMQLATLYEIKINGLSYLLEPLKKRRF